MTPDTNLLQKWRTYFFMRCKCCQPPEETAPAAQKFVSQGHLPFLMKSTPSEKHGKILASTWGNYEGSSQLQNSHRIGWDHGGTWAQFLPLPLLLLHFSFHKGSSFGHSLTILLHTYLCLGLLIGKLSLCLPLRKLNVVLAAYSIQLNSINVSLYIIYYLCVNSGQGQNVN